MKILDIQQNTEEWIKLRQAKIGASDIGVLMEGSEREIYEWYQIKQGAKQAFVNEAMKRGSGMEGEAIYWMLNIQSSKENKITALRDDPNDWMLASFDYMDEKIKFILEVKCPLVVLDNPHEHSHYKRWWWQIQAQLAVSGYEQATLLVYSPGKQVREIIKRDEKGIKKLTEKGHEYYLKLLSFTSLPVPKEIPNREDSDTFEWAMRFKEVDMKIKELEEEKQVLRDEGIALANEESFECAGVKVQKVTARESIDFEAACRAHNIDASTFIKKPKSPFTWRIAAT